MYYAHIIRPLDSGAMLNRAAACLCFMLANRDVNYNEWEGDMKSRYVGCSLSLPRYCKRLTKSCTESFGIR